MIMKLLIQATLSTFLEGLEVCCSCRCRSGGTFHPLQGEPGFARSEGNRYKQNYGLFWKLRPESFDEQST